ncbi:MAG: hypothetical protein ACRDH8_03495 [Actinomycetota bacterium]
MPANRKTSIGLVVTLAATIVLAGTSPALAQEATEHDNEFVVLTGQLDIPEGETFDSAVIFNGPATVAGTVRGPVVSFNGDVEVSGTVEESVVSFNGTVTVRSGAVIMEDLVTRTEPVIEEGATIQGDIRRETFDVFREPFPFWARFLSWFAVTVSLLGLGLLLLLLAPRGADAVAEAWRSGKGATIGWGLIFLVGLPLVGILALITLLGIPFGIGLLFALGLIYSMGYVAGAWLLGRQLLKAPSSRVLAFFLGLVILRAVALVPILAGIVGAVATVFGLGALIVAAWRAGRAVRTAATTQPSTP